MVTGPGTGWNVQIEGSGECSLKMFEVLKIAGDKSRNGCAGTASVSWTVQSLGRAKKK
jgi:hypothetical protein